MEGASDKKGDVVDHVTVGEIVHEFGEGADGVGAQVAEFGDQLVSRAGGEV